MDLSKFPAINASLNATSAFLLITGYIFIRQRALKAHVMCMVMAVMTSGLFLASYLYYHFHHGSTPFQGEGFIRVVYFTILISHTILAVVIVPMIFLSISRGVRGQFEKHARISRKTLPVWLYVSLTGVVIYWMLYRMEWGSS